MCMSSTQKHSQYFLKKCITCQFFLFLSFYVSSYNLSHLSLNREGRWITTDDFAASFLHFSLFSTALWDLANSRPVHSLMLSFYLFLSALSSSSFHCALQDGFGHTTAVCVSLRCPVGLRVIRLPVGSWHGLPRWSLYEMCSILR